MNEQIIPQQKTGVKPHTMALVSADKNGFAERAQKARLAAALASAQHDNLVPLLAFLQDEQAKRDRHARETWADYRIQQQPGSGDIIGIVTPPRRWQGQTVAFLYRIEKNEDGKSRFLGCPDQKFCDRVNEALNEIQARLSEDRKAELAFRLTTKHALIVELKRLDAVANGNWYPASQHPYPIIDSFSGEKISEGATQPVEPLPPLNFCFGILQAGEIPGTHDQYDTALGVRLTSPCYIKHKAGADNSTRYFILSGDASNHAYELPLGISCEETKAVMNRLRDDLCKFPERLAVLRERLEAATTENSPRVSAIEEDK